jgi:hypothetical protein
MVIRLQFIQMIKKRRKEIVVEELNFKRKYIDAFF